MKTPDELRAKLEQYPDIDSAIQVALEASDNAKVYTELAKEAKQAAIIRMPANTMKVKTPSGSAGYTQPKAKRLNKERWQEYLDANPDIASQIAEAESFVNEMQAAFMVTADTRFYIR